MFAVMVFRIALIVAISREFFTMSVHGHVPADILTLAVLSATVAYLWHDIYFPRTVRIRLDEHDKIMLAFRDASRYFNDRYHGKDGKWPKAYYLTQNLRFSALADKYAYRRLEFNVKHKLGCSNEEK